MLKTMRDGPLCMLLLAADMNTLSGKRREEGERERGGGWRGEGGGEREEGDGNESEEIKARRRGEGDRKNSKEESGGVRIEGGE